MTAPRGITQWGADNLRAAIEGHIARNPRITWPQLDAYFGRGNVTREIFTAALDALLASGRVVEVAPRQYSVAAHLTSSRRPERPHAPAPESQPLDLWGPT